MKFVAFLLVFTCLTLLSQAASNNDCTHDEQCIALHGKNCFCSKGQNLYIGECICDMDMDPNIFDTKPKYECSNDDHCRYAGKSNQLCYCSKNQHQKSGACQCISPLFG